MKVYSKQSRKPYLVPKELVGKTGCGMEVDEDFDDQEGTVMVLRRIVGENRQGAE